MSPDQPLLTVRGLTKVFEPQSGLPGRKARPVVAVNDVSFDIYEGETLGIVGESGSGKSTTAYCVLRLVEPTAGTIAFNGLDVTALSPAKLRRARREMQIVFQDPYSSLDPRMRVGAVIAEPLHVHGIGDRTTRRQRVKQLLELVGLEPGVVDRFPHEFSGGQRQRVGIARALALQPKLVVCDEPVSALDVSVQAQILNLLKDLQDQLGLTYLFISHDLAVIRTVSDRIAVMSEGSIVELAAADALFESPSDPYTQTLLSAIPVPDPREMRRRYAHRVEAEE
jgi:oligopeptide transport system ATP-binding protein